MPSKKEVMRPACAPRMIAATSAGGPRAVPRGERLHRGEPGHRRDIGGADVIEGEPAEAPHRRLIEPARRLGEARQHQRRILEGIEAAGEADAQGVARGEGRRRRTAPCRR